MPGLLDRIQAALDAGLATPLAELQALLVEAQGEHCRRRERITHRLTRFLTNSLPAMAAPSTTHQFKKAFKDQKAIIEVNGQTKAVTAANLADDDVPLLQRNGYGHFLEQVAGDPAGDEPHTEESLGKLRKDELHALHTEVVGEPAKSDAKKDELIAAILEAQTKQE